MLLCRCHTPTPMAWWIHIHYEPIPSICNSRKEWMCSHHPKHCTSNQARVTVAWFAKNGYIEGGQSVVVSLPYPKAHGMVDLHPLCTYTKSMQLLEATHVLISPPPNKARVTVAWFAIILYVEGGQSVVVPLPYHKAHFMVDLHPLYTYTKYVQLQEGMDVLISPSTLFIQPSKGHCSLVCNNLVF